MEIADEMSSCFSDTLKKSFCNLLRQFDVAFTQLSLFDCGKSIPNKNRRAYKIEITKVSDFNADGTVDLSDVRYLLKNKENTLTLLNGDSDFRSDECIELLKQSDIVEINPPFSLFREYVAQIIENGKDFIFICTTIIF